MISKTYLFYDIETTGLNPCFDQVLQFAAIRTDLELNELERHEISVTLNCDVVPSPGAVITHQIGIKQNNGGIPEIEAIQRIHALLNAPGTISLGYNTLGFDDEFLRFSFYRNLLPPYTHQYANQCQRMDLYPMTIMYYLFKPGVLSQWPEQDGKVSFKLEKLNAMLKLAEGQAHNAMVDVQATVALAKKFRQSREMWDYLTGYFEKNIDQERIAQLQGKGLLMDGKIGSKNRYLAPVLGLGQHLHYKNQTLWLRLDLENLNKVTPLTVPDTTYVIRKKAGEKEFLLPMTPRYLSQINVERQAIVEKNQIFLKENPDLFQAIRDYHRNYTYPKVPGIDASAALYEIGFPSDFEATLMQKFHQASPEKKMRIADQFPNLIHRELTLRIMGRHYPQYLTEQERELFQKYISEEKHVDYRNQLKLTITHALEEITALQKETSSLTKNQETLLLELKNYLSP